MNLYRNSICQFSGVRLQPLLGRISAERQVRACMILFMLLKTLEEKSALRAALLYVPDFSDLVSEERLLESPHSTDPPDERELMWKLRSETGHLPWSV